ncbi:rod-binding protein [Sphingobium sp. ZW T5_29]|uniref:rod-binding protein n=1 Tax=Sphingobium sp. ZW T5_29 TaxID=3378077 RepID=UPI003853B47D
MQISSVSSGVQPAASAQKAQLEKTAKQFEAIFLRQMIGTMRQSGGGEGIFDSSATDQFRDMSDARTADTMAEKGALGIAEMLLRQYETRQPVAAAGPEQDKGE